MTPTAARLGRAALALWLMVGAAAAGAAAPTDDCRASMRNRRVTLVVPYTAGGGFDTYARALAPVLEKVSGARVTVSNLPGAGGRLGMKAVADSGADAIRLGLFEGANMIHIARTSTELGLDKFRPLGTVAIEAQVWVARPGFALTPSVRQPIVASVNEMATFVVEVALAGEALGLKVRATPGYKGSVDRFAAVLRGEVDITANSVTSGIRAARAGDLAVALLLTDAPDPALPGVPHLAGKGGIVERFTEGAAPERRARAVQLAQSVVDLSPSFRTIVASAQLPAPTLQCLGDLVEASLFDEGFARAASGFDRPVRPRDRQATLALFERLDARSREQEALLRRLAAELGR